MPSNINMQVVLKKRAFPKAPVQIEPEEKKSKSEEELAEEFETLNENFKQAEEKLDNDELAEETLNNYDFEGANAEERGESGEKEDDNDYKKYTTRTIKGDWEKDGEDEEDRKSAIEADDEDEEADCFGKDSIIKPMVMKEEPVEDQNGSSSSSSGVRKHSLEEQ